MGARRGDGAAPRFAVARDGGAAVGAFERPVAPSRRLRICFHQFARRGGVMLHIFALCTASSYEEASFFFGPVLRGAQG